MTIIRSICIICIESIVSLLIRVVPVAISWKMFWNILDFVWNILRIPWNFLDTPWPALDLFRLAWPSSWICLDTPWPTLIFLGIAWATLCLKKKEASQGMPKKIQGWPGSV